MWGTVSELSTNSKAKFFNRHFHMNTPVLADKQKRKFIFYSVDTRCRITKGDVPKGRMSREIKRNLGSLRALMMKMIMILKSLKKDGRWFKELLYV